MQGYTRTEESSLTMSRRNVELADLQKQWLRLSPTAVQVRLDAGHDLPHDASDEVLVQITTALATAH